jgi:hypothetical protein
MQDRSPCIWHACSLQKKPFLQYSRRPRLQGLLFELRKAIWDRTGGPLRGAIEIGGMDALLLVLQHLPAPMLRGRGVSGTCASAV